MMYSSDWLEYYVRNNNFNFLYDPKNIQIMIDYGFICQDGNVLEKHWNLLFDIYRTLFIYKKISSLDLHDKFTENKLDDYIHSHFNSKGIFTSENNQIYFCQSYLEFKNLNLVIGKTYYNN